MLVFFVLLFLFRVSLDFLYVQCISQKWAYAGFELNPDLLKIIESYILYGLLLLIQKPKAEKPSDVFILVMFIGVLAPLLSMYGLANQARATVYMVILSYIFAVVLAKGRPFKIPVIPKSYFVGLCLAAGACAVVAAWFIVRGGLAYFNINLLKVYQFRAITGQLLNIGVFSYLNIWAVKVFSIALLSLFLLKRRFVLAAGIIGCQVFFFGVTGHKSTLFYPFLVLFFYFFFRKDTQHKLYRIPLSISLLWCFSYVIYIAGGPILFVSLFVRRVFFVIAKNTFDYYTFFSMNPKIFWSNKFFSKFIDYPYHVSPAILIGEWQGSMAHVNNTFLSTGYMHAGLVGVIVYGLLCGILLRGIDSLSRKIPLWFVLSVTFIPMFSLITSADFFTALLTHGIAVSCVMLWLFRGKARKSKVNSRIRLFVAN